MSKVINENSRSIRVVHAVERTSFISDNDREMDTRAVVLSRRQLIKRRFAKSL